MRSKTWVEQSHKQLFEKVESEMREGMALQKCRKCGCMKEELEQALALPQTPDPLKATVSEWLQQMEPIRYSCLGCDYCYPAVAASMLSNALPQQVQGPACGLETRTDHWPAVAGEYFVLDPAASVAISTLGSSPLAMDIADAKIPGVCIVAKTETENIGIDKIIKNTITNSAIRVLVVAGPDPRGHLPGATLVALHENGVDANQRVNHSPARRPFLRNVTREEVELFRQQVQVVNYIGLTNPDEIAVAVEKYASSQPISASCCGTAQPAEISLAPVIEAVPPSNIEMDRAGYFVILPDVQRKRIHVEHYSYDDRLKRVIQGPDARSIYWTIINNGWVSLLSHAAYLGKELAKAESSIRLNLPYLQDGA